MLRPRVIPVLTLRGRSLVKTMQFADPKYLGDPVNALRIFNTKEVDEIVILDITASPDGRAPDLGYVRDLAAECFMPVAFGGGVRSVDEVEALLRAGVEKVVVNTALLDDPELARRAAREFGEQAVVGSMDVVRRRLGGQRVARTVDRPRATSHDPVTWARRLEDAGVGELIVTCVERDGMADGYDLALVSAVAQAVSVPVVACGGAGGRDDLAAVLAVGAAGAGAGRMFVTHGKLRASLVSYLEPSEIESLAS